MRWPSVLAAWPSRSANTKPERIETWLRKNARHRARQTARSVSAKRSDQNPPSAGFFMAISVRQNHERITMKTWAAIALGCLMLAGGAMAVQAYKAPKVSINCQSKGGAGSCVVQNTGGTSADVDAQVILICRDGEHAAHLSARVEPNSHVTKIIEEFDPSVGLLTSCAGIDYRSVLVR